MIPSDSCFKRFKPLSILISLWCCSGACSDDHTSARADDQRLRGTANNLEMRIRGEILDFDGQPAQAPSVSVLIRDNNWSQPVDVKLDGHQFEAWLPVHRSWHSVRIQAESKDARRRATELHMRPSLRQVAMSGQTLTLQPSTRSVTVNIVHDNAPVAHANMIAETSEGAVLHFQCDASGSVEVDLLPEEKLASFTSWTNKPLFGGFQFSRDPVRNEGVDTQTIELHSCREQMFRVVDGQGNPCSDVEMFLHVATPPPHYNYLGAIEASRMITNKAGEAVFRWFPDWLEVHCYVDLNSDQWVIDGKSKWVDGDFVVQVKPQKKRRKVFGKLERDEGSKAGYCVFWRSFQGEQEGQSDFVNSVTDQQGNFSAEVLPGAAYCVFINDTLDVSNMVDLIPAPVDDAPVDTAVLHIEEPEMLEINVTAGPAKRPLGNQAVHIRQTHPFQWLEDGELRSGISARDRYVRTDDQGKATAVVESGKNVEVSIYNPDWRASEELHVVAGEQNSVVLHREIDRPRFIFGLVLQDENKAIPTDEITLVAGSVDGATRGIEQLKPREDGIFLFQTQAVAVGVLATTEDNSMAGVVVAENPRRILRLNLQPTERLRGRLIDSKGKPVATRTVHAIVRVKRDPKNGERDAFYGFEAFREKVMTDAGGYYTFDALPTGVEIALSAESLYKQERHWLGNVKLKANEGHAVDTYTIND